MRRGVCSCNSCLSAACHVAILNLKNGLTGEQSSRNYVFICEELLLLARTDEPSCL